MKKQIKPVYLELDKGATASGVFISASRKKHALLWSKKSGNTEQLYNSRIRKKNNACYRAQKKEVKRMLYNSKAFGVVIGRLRMKKGMTQESMSGLAGIARSHLAALENGEKTVKLSTLWAIAYALDLKPSELIRLVEKEMESG